MKNISTYLSVGWDFIEETDNGISDDWSIDNSSFSDNLNKGYPYFDNESFSDSTLIRLPVRILPNTDIRARTTVASVTFTAIVPEGGATNITATSLDTNIVDVEVTNTQTQDSITTALLTFTYKGAVGTENSTQIKIEASNANRPDGKLILNYYQDQTSPSITTSFEVDNKFRIGAESGENLKIKIKADEPIASGLINLNGWGIDITDNIEIDSLNNKIGYYILDVPSNSVLTEGMTSISMEITDLAGNYNTSTASVVLANSRVPTNGEIESVAHFTWLIDTGYDGSSAVLTQDIDLQGITFYPMSYIKAYNDNNTNFSSSEAKLNLDGGGFKISNLFIDSSSYDFPYTSLVGRSSSSTHIRNINFDNAHVISENSYTAILVSSVYNGNFHDITIENSRVDVLGSANTDYVSLVLAQGDHLGSARTNIIFKNNTINAPKSNRVGLLVGQGNYPRNHWYNISSENDSIYAKSHGIGMIMGIINNAGWGNNDGLIFEDVSVQNGFISISENPDQVGMLFGRYENSVSPSNQAESEDDSIYNWNRISATGTITTELDSTNNRGYNVGGLTGYMRDGKKFKKYLQPGCNRLNVANSISTIYWRDFWVP